MKFREVQNRDEALVQALLRIWEDSARATHRFLSNAEVERIKAYVPQALQGVSHLIVAEDCSGVSAAFMGTEGERLEMLFLTPAERGKGLGKQWDPELRDPGGHGKRAEPPGCRVLRAHRL